MFAVAPTFTFGLGLTPFAPEHWGILVFLVIATAAGVWYFYDKKIRTLLQQHADQAAAAAQAHATAMQAQKEAATAQAAAAQRKLDEAAAAHQRLEAQHAAHIEAARHRQQEDAQRISSLGTDLAATHQLAAQLEPTQMRVKDLETALISERGRVSALEQALDVSNKRATDFETRLEQTHRSLSELRQSAGQREIELQSSITRLEQVLRDNETLVNTAESQIAQATETLSSYKQQAETRITNLQRQLAAAEAKSALVQKEFMSAVGVLPDKPSSVTRTTPAAEAEDKRVAALESRITQLEADSRKKAREDGYKIAELEFRLSEAQEALAKKAG